MEQALNSPAGVTPFPLSDCTPQSDGAAVAVTAAEAVLGRSINRPVGSRGVRTGLDSVMLQHEPDRTCFPEAPGPAERASTIAGLTRTIEDAVEVHDCPIGIGSTSSKPLRFAERLDGYKLLDAEQIKVGGTPPLNTSGGFMARGHPPGVTGVAQCVELCAHSRAKAAIQAESPRLALAHSIGSPTAVSAVTILEGPTGGKG